MNKGQIAKEYFKQGYNCAQSTAMAFAKEINMAPEMIAKLTIGYGGGMGRMREVCGSISGVAFVLSALYGDKPKNDVYKMVQDVSDEFKRENGSIVCRELLGLSKNEPITHIAEKRTEEYYRKRPCADLVEIAANALEKYLKELNA